MLHLTKYNIYCQEIEMASITNVSGGEIGD